MVKFFIPVALTVQILAGGSGVVKAESISFNVSNKSGVSINTITAAPKSGGDPITVNASTIATDTTTPVAFQSADGDCVFTLTTTLDSGNTLSNPDTDLCQTDTLVLQ